MSKTEVLDLLKKISKDVENLNVRMNTIETKQGEDISKCQEMFKILNAKIDIFKNLESESREAVLQKTASGKRPTKPSFMKLIFINERDQHMNILYTQDEIDALYETDEVKAKKKEADRTAKVASMIYTEHIKKDNPPGRESAFESIYKNRYS